LEEDRTKNIVQKSYLLSAIHCVHDKIQRRYLRVRGNRRHRQRSRAREMYKEIKGTGDLNGKNGGGSTISSVVVEKEVECKMHPQNVSEDEKHVRLVKLMLEAC
jgi:hypothetical protein